MEFINSVEHKVTVCQCFQLYIILIWLRASIELVSRSMFSFVSEFITIVCKTSIAVFANVLYLLLMLQLMIFKIKHRLKTGKTNSIWLSFFPAYKLSAYKVFLLKMSIFQIDVLVLGGNMFPSATI